ncbi:MAG: response regulator [Deltaproteobacteria bacterium]|nr:response regulator [Deltaproteobacteria bacterium]
MKYLLSRVTLGTFSVCLLVLLLALFSIYSAGNISRQAEQMYQHPYTVKSAAQAMRTRLMEMQLYLLPTMLITEKTEDEATLQMLVERDHLQDLSFDVIRQYYIGPTDDERDADLAALEEALSAVRQARLKAVQDCAGVSSPREIMIYLEQHIGPRGAAMDAALQRIMDSADTRVSEFRVAAESTRNIMIVGTALLCLLLAALIIFVSASERRKNREIAHRDQLFKLLSRSIADVFFIYDHTNRHLEYVSENCYRLFGITMQEFYRDGAIIERGLTPETIAEFHAMLADSSLSEAIERDIKYQRGHQTLDLKMRVYPIQGPKKARDNSARRSIVMFTDQTSAVAQQAALNDALILARKANNAKQDFLSRMSHEIRTPMNAIIGMTTIAAKYLGDKERVADCLDKISISSKHLLSLINDVLDLAKIEGGKFSFASGPFDFRSFINTLTAIIYPQTLARQQKFEITIAGLSEETLVGDDLRLNQILINLLSNAIKFTPPDGEIRLDITCLSHEGSSVMLRFAVSDTGIGMSKEFMSRLYTPFEQDNNVSRNYGGTGLGLAITQNLVALMSGSINVESVEGKGTTFTLEMPFGLPEQAAESQRSLEWSDMSVLVADDDQVTCEHAMLLLEQIGVHGDSVNSGPEALEKVTQARKAGRDYTVCFIDWRMPGMDGVETARRLREKVGEETPIIIISSYDWSSIEQEARVAGVNGFIAKPLFTSSLYNVLASIRHPEKLLSDSTRPNEQYDFKDKKILLAEDNHLNQEIAVEILQSAGLCVDCANNGQQAVDMYQQSGTGEYDLILMDVQMPVMDGHAATQAIRALNRPDAKTIPILAMTANVFNSDIHAAEQAGMNGHLAKPIDMPALFRTLAEYLK